MTEQEFDRVWQEAEVEALAQRMAQEYPAWVRRKKRLRNSIVAAMFVGAVAATTLPLLRPNTHKEYMLVCCNRSNSDDEQWVQLAANMLMNDMI